MDKETESDSGVRPKELNDILSGDVVRAFVWVIIVIFVYAIWKTLFR